MKVFERAGFRSEGIDPGGEFLSYSRDKLRADVQVRSLYDLTENSCYDTVLLIHVIEHLRSPKAALERIAELLKPNGMFYVECPNLQAPFARRSQLFHTAHIHNIVPSTLKMLAESCGFELQCRYGDERDPNLQMLFRKTGRRQLNIDSDNYRRTIADLKQADPLPYHLRMRYVTDRLQKLASYAKEHLFARRFVDQLVKTCSPEVAPEKKQQRAA